MEENEVLKKIRELCSKYGYSNYRLSKESNVPESTINSLFQNNTYPSIPTLYKICKGFSITISDFFLNEDYPPDITEETIIINNIYQKLTPEQKDCFNCYLAGLTEN